MNIRSALLAMTLTLGTLMICGTPLWASGEITHPHHLHGMPLLERGNCTDNETGERGVCFVIQGHDAIYMAFHHFNGRPIFLRRLNEDGTYSTIWHYATGDAVPSGLPL